MDSIRSSRRDMLRTAVAAGFGAAVVGAEEAMPAFGSAEIAPPDGKRARIATVCQRGNFKPSIAENREYVMSLLDQACQHKPDLVCLPETFPTVGPPSKLPRPEKSEPVPGPTIDAAAARAKQYGCYVICPLATYRDGKHFNSAVILDRRGQIVGIYDKACPVTSTADYTVMEGGITPGTPDIPVFDLDFGRIGIQICFDLGFAENWERLAKKGARLVLWPSAYDGGFPLWAYAYLHHYYVISSVRQGQSRIIDPCGDVLLETDNQKQVIVRDLNLDFVVSHLDFNRSIPDKILAKYGDRVDVRRSNPGSNHFLVEPIDPAITCRQLQEEFGFESTQQYHNRHRELYPTLRAGQQPPKQQALHGERPMHAKF
ncbi:MAG: carbon-nitrogen hydrolase family protein [Planctomycetota bacterium]